MNIVKFKDVVIQDNNVFNEIYKGRYAYCINWTTVVTLDMPLTKYIEYSQGYEMSDDDIITYHALPYNDIEIYIDGLETHQVNAVNAYIYKNNFTTDSDITVEEVKYFRTHLANLLDEYYEHNTDSVNERLLVMIDYYVNEMIDDTIKNMLLMLNYGHSTQHEVKYSACGCSSGTSTVEIIDNTSCVSMYRNGVKSTMIEYFSNIDFWHDKIDICNVIVKYLKNIVKLNLLLTSDITNVACANINADTQAQEINKLNNIILAFEHIINNDIVGNKNFIGNSLYNFALIYENLKW